MVFILPFFSQFCNQICADLESLIERPPRREARYANSDIGRLPVLVDELIALDVDVLFVTYRAVRAAKRATATVPIVSTAFYDPVAEGLVESLARPGGNVTGLSWQTPETSGKRLELIMQLVPGLERTALLFEPSDPGALLEANALRSAARRAGVTISLFELRNASDLAAVLAAMGRQRPQTLIVGHSAITVEHRERIASFAIRNGLPLVSEGSEFAEAGALLTYGPNVAESFRRAAHYVDQILKGAKPGDLPIEQPTKFDLVVNLKTAKALGLTIPQPMLLRASEVIR
jgi:putative ABC transport system substrate-binding protein